MSLESLLSRGFLVFIALCLATGTRAITPYKYDGFETDETAIWSLMPARQAPLIGADAVEASGHRLALPDAARCNIDRI